MFNNANVIFRTKFVDGTSTVTRTVNAMRQDADENDEVRNRALRQERLEFDAVHRAQAHRRKRGKASGGGSSRQRSALAAQN
jgi:hypothetical protein